MTRKVCIVITSRASYARIRTALEAIRSHPDLKLQLVAAASALLGRYGNAVEVIKEEGFEIDRQVYMILDGENLVTSAKSTGLGLAELATVFDDLRPDLVTSVADRFETISTAVAASYLNIPLAHVQGGEITGSIDEKVRHAVTKLADIHLVSSQRAADRVIKMGERPEAVHVTGCPSIDLARHAVEAGAEDPRAILRRYGGVGAEVDPSKGYIVVLQHPVTTEYELAHSHTVETLEAVRSIGYPTFWFWPNVDAGSDHSSKAIRTYRERYLLPNVHFYKNFRPSDFLNLLLGCGCIVGNSSVAVRECSYLGVPAVNIGNRQRGRDRGRNLVDVDYDRSSIADAIAGCLEKGHSERDTLYGDGTAGEKIGDVLAKAPLTIDKMLAY